MKTTTNIIYSACALFALACFALVPTPKTFGVSPPPDGGYSGFNTAEGQNALLSLTTGVANTAVGWFSLESNVSNSFNTAVGAGTLVRNSGDSNTAVGAVALLSNTTGTLNTANGAVALFSNTAGSANTAIGWSALSSNTGGLQNTATGAGALDSNTLGIRNTATGDLALGSNTLGSENTADGFVALLDNNGTMNTAIGARTLGSNTTGSENTAIGWSALDTNSTGINNIAVGVVAGTNLTTGSNNIDMGNVGVAGESNTIRIGTEGTQTATYIAGINGTAVVGDTVVVDGNGQLGTATSSARFKKEIRAMDKASEAILALKPVSFQYKSDSQRTPRFGLIAEEVAKVNPDLVVRDRKGEIYSVRYEAVNAMLLNEFLKEHSTVQELKKEVAALTAGLQKVSAQLEASKPAPQVVNNP